MNSEKPELSPRKKKNLRHAKVKNQSAELQSQSKKPENESAGAPESVPASVDALTQDSTVGQGSDQVSEQEKDTSAEFSEGPAPTDTEPAAESASAEEPQPQEAQPESADADSASPTPKTPASERPAFKGRTARKPANQTTEKNPRSAKHKKPLSIGKKIAIALGCIFLVFVAIVAGYSLDRWVLHDDQADLEGVWVVYGSTAQVTITEDTLVLSSDVSYHYTIDTTAKTITYTLGNLSGTSHYRFSPDRTTVALMEDNKKVFTATLLDDLNWLFSNFGAIVSGNTVLPGEESDTTALFQTAAAAQAAAEAAQAAAAEQAAAEQAAAEAAQQAAAEQAAAEAAQQTAAEAEAAESTDQSTTGASQQTTSDATQQGTSENAATTTQG